MQILTLRPCLDNNLFDKNLCFYWKLNGLGLNYLWAKVLILVRIEHNTECRSTCERYSEDQVRVE